MNIMATKSKTIFQMEGVPLLAATGALSIAIAASAAVPTTSPRAQASQSQPAGVEKFRGGVWPALDTGESTVPSPYEMYDENHKTYVFLDGKKMSEPLDEYIGRRVEITGTLDAKARIVHIESIKSIGWSVP